MQMKPPETLIKDIDDEWEEFENEDEQDRCVPKIKDAVDAQVLLLNQKSACDKLIHKEVQLQLGEKVQKAKVKQRSLGPDGLVVGINDDNAVLNSIACDIEFPG